VTALLPQEFIRTKRDGRPLPAAEIDHFIAGIAKGTVTHAQIAAFAMAVFFRGMTTPECVALTRAMTASGTVLRWDDLDLPGPVIDKHSTGGIGDNVSLILAPLIAACGGFVPMISGRGLGHTGGTLDKLDAIPGYRTQPDIALFRRAVAETGAAIIGQTPDLAPADKTIYAIRDVTGTVESIPLITASILSKKLAAGLQSLVMDVKTGSGAFMQTHDGSRALAASIAAVATSAGLPTTALITAMDQPLASAAGNAVEIRNAIDFLTGQARDPRLHEVTHALAVEMLLAGGLASDAADAGRRIDIALASGAAAERFARMVSMLGGPADLLERPHAHLTAAPVVVPVEAATAGSIASVDARLIGVAVVALGGGRTRPQDAIDPAVGFTGLAAIGDAVGKGRPLAFVHARTEEAAERAAAALRDAYSSVEGPPALPAVLERLTG
jgi:thymidine phosphorylase